ncbi:mRNA-capping enzyme subunit alpha [Venustampulla echinocandica]|uniref:mRNA-capping enzyme subunit alpha n=1 Tax=Venustampulla echinocandica TaxID=2656787 RepID=A0A370TGW2_9HELO|nr:mRNA-capping enzyme subunit alpha [Venustampulla echinocandica]RDL34435.1 mRNA-capping enzyme subunit alpha [Venustampulla echinocandica]
MADPNDVLPINEPGMKIEGDALYALRREVAQLLDRKNLGFPGAQPVSFARRHLEELTKQDYYVCEKSDGLRYLLYLTTYNDEEAHYLIDRRNDFWIVPKNSLHFPVPRDVQGFHVSTLIDGELVLDKLPDGKLQPKYLVFDCMILDGNSLMSRTLDKRLAYFQERIYDPYKQLLQSYPQEIPFMHFIVEMKSMQFSYAIELMFAKILPDLPHGNDGLIFTCRTSEYKHGTDPHILKWKPEDENSIDFRLILDFPLAQPDEQDIAEGVTEPYPDYDAMPICNLHAFAGDGREDPWFSTMHLEPKEWEGLKALKERLNDRIVECYMDSQKRWRYMRFRDDKENANHTSTVQSVIESITDRVTKQDLTNAQKVIRDEWKRRAADEQARERKEAEKRRAASASSGPLNAGVKRKADGQGNGRPSPGPPMKKEL